MDGIINILKPPGMTSHDVVSVVRKKAQMKKVGHTGTLDPNAAGVLPICLGQATKVSNYLLNSTKMYRAECTLGVETDTEDKYGAILRETSVSFSKEQIEEAVMSFEGIHEQIPPMYSALKVKGKKLYELARQGIEIERKPRRVQIDSINIIKIDQNKVIFDVLCSKGTYIRTLCKDIGDKLGCGGMMSFLLRIQTGDFKLENSISIEEFKDAINIESILLDVDVPLQHLPKVIVKQEAEKKALNGNKIAFQYLKMSQALAADTEVRVYLEKRFIGIAKVQENQEQEQYIKFSRLFI
ncbi:tRNA pseudouridine synthase B [Alkaliphilus metalliredigens QYMF]|uniref:tRNA pseudouridine synthase B n=1 Tax=Alkaliphilus metalliredigens (strain QYMF) TaxID=293826 RepID=A6TRK4_ALKMQ|nr:tRNA pseudouridine(55) synthase TruB [Alkaliphilus metalliredigens]ABR48822.1 tRNA pseudouridine synthase B [Alkaliphilus metalliredigens QYMF]